jgi:hypothetical protein
MVCLLQFYNGRRGRGRAGGVAQGLLNCPLSVSKPFANWEAVSEPLIAGCMFLKCDNFCGLGRYGFLESEDFGLKLGDVLGASRDRQCEEDDQCSHAPSVVRIACDTNAHSTVISGAIGTTS